MIFTFEITSPALWWPVHQGPQTLLDLVITLDGRTVTKRVGLRRMELVSVHGLNLVSQLVSDFLIKRRYPGAWIFQDIMSQCRLIFKTYR